MARPLFAWVDAQAQAHRPFLLTVMTNVGHHDYQLPPSWASKAFASARFPDDPTYLRYLNCLAYVDDWIATIVRGFEERGLDRSTVFVILGDHGESFADHEERQHIGVLYEEGIHIPALIYAPGRDLPPGKVAGLRQQIDILPTVVELLGYRPTGGVLVGSSLLHPAPAQRHLFFSGSLDGTYLALRDDTRKYIYTFGRSPLRVFDEGTDPLERHDLRASLSDSDAERIESELLLTRARVEASLLRDGHLSP